MALDFSTAEFDCGHIQKVRLPVSNWSWCDACGDTRSVTRVREYRYRCDDCQAAGAYGGAFILAQRGAARHRARYPGHRVSLFYGERLLRADPLPPAETLF